MILGYAPEHRAAVERRMASAAREPRTLPELVSWLRREWDGEVPTRIHERGTEPESALGSPRMAAAFRSYLMGSPMATDHDDRLDVDHRGAVRRYPIHAALAQMARSGRWPFSVRLISEIAWSGADWQDVTLHHGMTSEVGYRFLMGALQHLWAIWARDQVEG